MRASISRLRQHLRKETGAATAELALALPAVIVLFAVVVTFMSAGSERLKCIEAARSVARMEIAADSTNSSGGGGNAESPEEISASVLGHPATVSVTDEKSFVRVTVESPIFPGPLGVFPAKVQGEAVAYKESQG
jgi:hypothetical protein